MFFVEVLNKVTTDPEKRFAMLEKIMQCVLPRQQKKVI